MLTFADYYPNPMLSKSECCEVLRDCHHHNAVVLVSDITHTRYRISTRMDSDTGEFLYRVNDHEFSYGEAIQYLMSIV